ncbi:MAG TPA: hypothetical protein VIX80_03390 [Candidatus Kapabacteria bacterium]
MQSLSPEPRKHQNLFKVAYRHFPGRLLSTAIGVSFLSTPLLHNFFRDSGIDSLFVRILLIGVVIITVPLIVIYLLTLLRAVKIRKRLEGKAELREEIRIADIETVKEQQKVDEREEILTQKAERIDLNTQIAKQAKEDERWDMLHERLRIQEERNDEQDRQQLLRDGELIRMRKEDQLKDHYKTLFDRYLRNSQGEETSQAVADGLISIPEIWLTEQPEIQKDPGLMESLKPYNKR